MTLVVDASVAVKWVVSEDGRSEALARTAGQVLVAPDFVVIEAANILWKKVRLKQLDQQQARDGLNFIRGAYARYLPTDQLMGAAFSLALEFDHPVYDCLYLACSKLEGADLLTADRRLAGIATRTSSHVALIGSSP